MLIQLPSKNQKHVMLPFPIKRIKHFGPILESFCPKTTVLSRYISPNFQFLSCCNFMQKVRKFSASICYQTQKTRFGPLFVQKNQCSFFPKKSFERILSPYAAVTLQTKLEKIHSLIVQKISKTLFQDFASTSQKKLFSSVSKLYISVTLC